MAIGAIWGEIWDEAIWDTAIWSQSGADTTAPVLSAAAGAASNDTEASGSVSSDEAGGTLYWVVTKSSTGPSVAQVQAGQNHLGAAADDNGSQGIASVGSQFVSASGLTASTTYYFHFQADDAVGNDSTVVSSASFATPAAGADDYWVHARDARYRSRLSWGLGCVLLLLMAGCTTTTTGNAYCENVTVYVGDDATPDSARYSGCDDPWWEGRVIRL